jgi:glucose-6-phosphate isomerase
MLPYEKPINEMPTWKSLQELSSRTKGDLQKWSAKEPDRALDLSITTEHLLFDFSRQLITKEILERLMEPAEEIGLAARIQQMFAGEKINVTENRAVLHTALRNLSPNPVYVDSQDMMPAVRRVLDQIKGFSEKVVHGRWLGAKGDRLKNIFSIGIGGSYLGQEFLAEACKRFALSDMTLRFIANFDPTDFARQTQDLEPAETLVILVSKTFTTSETMANAHAAKCWITDILGNDPAVIRQHFVAISTAAQKVKEFGIDPGNMFEFWDWVGGRYSASSAVGDLPLPLYLGYAGFLKILDGAFWMDQHFRSEPLRTNIPIIAGLIDIWNITLWALAPAPSFLTAKPGAGILPTPSKPKWRAMANRLTAKGVQSPFQPEKSFSENLKQTANTHIFNCFTKAQTLCL